MDSHSLLKRFRELNIDRDSIELSWSGNDISYFCTPLGAEIIGWLGVDGIHFCFIPALSNDMVFAVSPIPCGKNYVEPIALNFADFLGLVVSCGVAGLLEQVSWVSEADFAKRMEVDGETLVESKDAALNEIQKQLGIKKLTDPYNYIKAIQEGFDYSSIQKVGSCS